MECTNSLSNPCAFRTLRAAGPHRPPSPRADSLDRRQLASRTALYNFLARGQVSRDATCGSYRWRIPPAYNPYLPIVTYAALSAVGCACGSAVRTPEATIVSNEGFSAPLLPHAVFQLAPRVGLGHPGRDAAMASANAREFVSTEVRMASISAADLTIRCFSTSPLWDERRRRLQLLLQFGICAERQTRFARWRSLQLLALRIPSLPPRTASRARSAPCSRILACLDRVARVGKENGLRLRQQQQARCCP